MPGEEPLPEPPEEDEPGTAEPPAEESSDD